MEPAIPDESRRFAQELDARHQVTEKRLAYWATLADYLDRRDEIATLTGPGLLWRLTIIAPARAGLLVTGLRHTIARLRLNRSCASIRRRDDAYEVDSWLVWVARTRANAAS